MRWTIDAGDPSAFSDARRLIASGIAPEVPDSEDRFAIETVIGEILAAASHGGSTGVTIEFQCSRLGAIVETWDDGSPIFSDGDSMQRAILATLATYIDVSRSDTGNHVVVRLPFREPGGLANRSHIWQLAGALVIERSRAVAARLNSTLGRASDETNAGDRHDIGS